MLAGAGSRLARGAKQPRASLAILSKVKLLAKATRQPNDTEKRRKAAMRAVTRGLLDPRFGAIGKDEEDGLDAASAARQRTDSLLRQLEEVSDDESEHDDTAAGSSFARRLMGQKRGGVKPSSNEMRAQPAWASRKGMRVRQGGRALLNAAAPAGPFSEEELLLLAGMLSPPHLAVDDGQASLATRNGGEMAHTLPLTARGRLQRPHAAPRADIASELQSAVTGSAALAFARQVEEEQEATASSRGARRRRASLTMSAAGATGPAGADKARGGRGGAGKEAEARAVAEAVAGTSARLAAAAASSLIIAAQPSAAADSVSAQASTSLEAAAALCASAAAVSANEIQAYLRFCAAARCEPARHLLRQLPRPAIVLSGRGLGSGHATHAFALAAALPRCLGLSHLDVSSNCLSDESAGAICRALAVCPARIGSLDLSDNSLSAACMADVAAAARRVQFLGLAGQTAPGIDGLGAFAFVAGLLTLHPSVVAEIASAAASAAAASASAALAAATLAASSSLRPRRPVAPPPGGNRAGDAPSPARRSRGPARPAAGASAPLTYVPPLWQQDHVAMRYGVGACLSVAAAVSAAAAASSGAGHNSHSGSSGGGGSRGAETRKRDASAALAAATTQALVAVRSAPVGPLFGGPPARAAVGGGATPGGAMAAQGSAAAATAARFASSRRMSTRLAQASVHGAGEARQRAVVAPAAAQRGSAAGPGRFRLQSSSPSARAARRVAGGPGQWQGTLLGLGGPPAGAMHLSTSVPAPVHPEDVILPKPTAHTPRECRLKELDLSRCGLTDKSAGPLSRLAALPALESLDLAWNALGSRGALPFLRCLAEPGCLLLPLSVASAAPESAEALASGQSTALWKAARAAWRKRRQRLRRLLSRLQRSGKGGARPAGSSSSGGGGSADDKSKDYPKAAHSPLESVLGGAPAGGDPVLASMRLASLPPLPGPLPKPRLRALHLAFCGLDDAVAPVLVEMLAGDLSAASHDAALPSLTELDLSSNKLGERTGRLLALAVSHNTSLKALRLGFNPLGKLATIAIVRSLDATRSPLALDVESGMVAGEGLDAARSAAGAGLGDASAGTGLSSLPVGSGAELWVGGNTTLSELGLENTCIPVDRGLEVPPGLLDELAAVIDEDGVAVAAATEAVEAEMAQEEAKAASGSGSGRGKGGVGGEGAGSAKGGSAGRPAAGKSGTTRPARHARAKELLRHLMPAHFGCAPTSRATAPSAAAKTAAVRAWRTQTVSLLSLGSPGASMASMSQLAGVDAEAALLEDKLAGLRRLRGSPLAGLALPDEAAAEAESSDSAMQDVWETLHRVLARRPVFALVAIEFPEQPRALGGRLRIRVDAGSSAAAAAAAEEEWSPERSVFRSRLTETDAEALVDTPELMDRCFEADWAHTKMESLLPDATQRAALKPVLKQFYPITRELYRLYCSSSSNDAFSISFNLWTDMRRDMGISSRDKDAMLDTAFFAANVEVEDDAENPNHALCRYELQEVLVRSALIMYPAGEGFLGPASSLELLLTRHIVPAAMRMFGLESPEEPFSNQFRIDQLYQPDTDAVLRKFYRQVSAMFRAFGSTVVDSSKLFMSLPQWTHFLATCGFFGKSRPGDGDSAKAGSRSSQSAREPAPMRPVTERDARSIFLFSNPTVIDELHRNERANKRFRHTHLTLASFMEALARLASSPGCPTNLPPELAEQLVQQVRDSRVAEAATKGGGAAAAGTRRFGRLASRNRMAAGVGLAGRGSPSSFRESVLGEQEPPEELNPWGPSHSLGPLDLASRLTLTLIQCSYSNRMSLRGVSLRPPPSCVFEDDISPDDLANPPR